jgi:hypothetical protein
MAHREQHSNRETKKLKKEKPKIMVAAMGASPTLSKDQWPREHVPYLWICGKLGLRHSSNSDLAARGTLL